MKQYTVDINLLGCESVQFHSDSLKDIRKFLSLWLDDDFSETGVGTFRFGECRVVSVWENEASKS